MTKKEFLTEIMNSNVSEELKQYAIEHLEKQTPKQLENAALQDEIYSSYLGEEPVTAGEVAKAMEISTQKASALLLGLVSRGLAAQCDRATLRHSFECLFFDVARL